MRQIKEWKLAKTNNTRHNNTGYTQTKIRQQDTHKRT